jgi:hypothetical protein
MRVEAILKTCDISVGPHGRKRLFFGHNDVQGGFEVPRSVRRLRRDRCSQYASQSIDRIARITVNVAFCRTFPRAVLLVVVDRQRTITDRSHKYRPRIDRPEMSRFAGLSPYR